MIANKKELIKTERLPSFIEPKNLDEAKLSINQLGRNLHEHAYLVGMNLIWVKKQFKHGEFIPWIENNVWFNRMTACRFMAFAIKCIKQGYLLEYHPNKRDSNVTPCYISGTYQTVIIDPPWPIEKIERYERPYQEPNLDYVTMTIEAIEKSKMPISKNAHVYLWTIQKFLPTAFEIFETWDVKYIQTLVWHKNVGFTPHGLFMNNAEFVLFGRRGSLPLLKAGEKVVFTGKVREHSRKPDEFYDLVKKVSPEPRIDIFSREKRDGFDSFGNETEKFQN
jgi:N6-adenosine-specific RNA methylase IME4